MTDVATASPYASKIKKPSPIKSTGIPKLAVSPAKPTKLPTSKPVTRTVSASAHSHTTGQLTAPPSDDNPPNTPSTPTTPSKSPNSARKSVGGTHRLHTPNSKESTGGSGGSSGIPSYAKPTFANSTRLPYAGAGGAYAATAGASSIPAPKSILKKAVSPSGTSSALPNKAAAVTQRLTSTQPLPPTTHSRSASSTVAAKGAQAVGKHAKQSSLALSGTQSRIPGYGSAGGSKTGSSRASAQSSARTSRQGSVGSGAAVPASPELASILAQAQAAQAQVAEVQRQSLAVHSRGHSRAGSVASNASNASAGSVLSPQSAQHDSLLDEHDPLDDIDVDTSFDDVLSPTDPLELNSAPPAIDESNEVEPEEDDQQQQQQQEEEQPQALDGVDEEFAATDDVFDIVDPARDNNLIETPFKPADHEEKTQDTDHHTVEQQQQQTVADAAWRVEKAEESKQTVIITAPQLTVQERRSSTVHELSATPEPNLEEKEDNSYKTANKPAAQPIIDMQVVSPTVDATELHAASANTNTLSLDSNNAITINGGSTRGLGVRKASLSQSSDAAAPVTVDLVIGSSANETDDAEEDGDEYEDEEYEEGEDENGQAVPIVLSLNITIGSNGQIVQQTIEPAPVVDTHDTSAKIELITDEQAAADQLQEQQATHRTEQAPLQAQEKAKDQVEDEPESASLTVVEQQPAAPQSSQFTTIIIDRDTSNDSFDTNNASPPTRTPAPTITEQVKPNNHDAILDLTLLPTRTPAPSNAVPAGAVEQSTEIVIESPASAFPSTLTSYDTLHATSRDQPSVSSLEPVIRAPASSNAAPVIVTPVESTTPVVKSVAFSDEVTALGGGKEERSESLDFGDDFSLPTTPLRGSVMEGPTASYGGGNTLQPISSISQSSTAHSAAAASISRLKELEAERRAEEDKRRADEEEVKRTADEQERTAEAERVEQQQAADHQAEQKVREQLEESKRSLFAQMREGIPVTKLGKKGNPRDTRIFITGDDDASTGYTIHWDSKSKKAEDAQMALTDCRCVVGGDEGMFVHRKYAGKYDGVRERCVSVVSAVRGLDIVVKDEEAVNRLVAMLRLCACPVREAN